MWRDWTFILALLCLFVAVAEWLVRRTVFRHAGTALTVILITAVAANVGVLPAGSTAIAPVPVYDHIFTYLAPLAIFWLLLLVNLRDILRAGLPIVGLFLIGAAGIIAGAFLAAMLVPLDTAGPLHRAIGGMFAATYTGGSINFNAVALHYNVVREGALYTGAVAVDNVVTTLWMVATLAAPRVLAPLWPHRSAVAAPDADRTGVVEDTETLHPLDLALLGLAGLTGLFVSNALARATGVPSILYMTTLALVLAQLEPVTRLRGARVLGMFAVYLFLAVIGAFCDVRQLLELRGLGLLLLGFASIMVIIHGAVCFGAARVLRMDPGMAAVASQANVGGSTSALALARSIGRPELVLPAVLIGSLGNAIGTFIGFWVTARLP
jgi:uncharacterized membrane protein